jgi:hypothetical protein
VWSWHGWRNGGKKGLFDKKIFVYNFNQPLFLNVKEAV